MISNGISPEYTYGKLPKEPWMERFFNVLMVGRYAGEKRQDKLIDACAKSRHAGEIQVILAGKGPLEKKYRRLAEKLPNPIVMEFYEPSRLLEILHMADLYVHTSDAEIEAMSCMEAFACGLVPVIADSPRSATPQFALDGRSLFPAGDTDALAERIDWWIEHPEERAGDGAPLRRARPTVLPGGIHPQDGGDVPAGHRGAEGRPGLSKKDTAAAVSLPLFLFFARQRNYQNRPEEEKI